MGLVFGALPEPPTPPVLWTGLAMKWKGADGSEWTLSDSSDGTVMMPGVRGLNMPPLVHHRTAHASVPGARWRGLHVDVREVFWPLQVYSDLSSEAWVEKDRAFWKSLNPEKTGTWSVILPNGESRSLKLRFTDDGGMTYSHDAVKSGWASYGLQLEAEQPFWEGTEIVSGWQEGVDVPFFSGGGGPAFAISPTGTFSKAEAENPGDVDAWPVWRIYGPATSATVGVNGKTITIPISITAGQYVRIDTNPTAQTALHFATNGNVISDKTGLLTGVNFAPLPPGKSKLTMTQASTGGGRITATFTPRYYRAW